MLLFFVLISMGGWSPDANVRSLTIIAFFSSYAKVVYLLTALCEAWVRAKLYLYITVRKIDSNHNVHFILWHLFSHVAFAFKTAM